MRTDFDLKKITRKNIYGLIPYSPARAEFSGSAGIFLDANENSLGSPAGEGKNRYPDPLQKKVKEKIASIKNVSPDQIFIGNGSDEAIDILFRSFCVPGQSNVIILPPTYGMYEVSAEINDIRVKKVPLLPGFRLNTKEISKAINEETRLIFFCNPNNPTGTLYDPGEILAVAENFSGIVVADEAYMDFASVPGMMPYLEKTPNLVILQTFSKAWGMAGLRAGMAFGSPEIINIFNKVKPPYNINSYTQEKILEILDNPEKLFNDIRIIKEEREKLVRSLEKLERVERVFPSDANFILVKISGAGEIYNLLKRSGIIVRNRSQVEQCEDCLRITIGTPEENDKLLKILKTNNLKIWRKKPCSSTGTEQ